MSNIRSSNTLPEKRVRSLLHGLGYRFRLHRKDLPGSPDIVLPKYRTVIFIHGCYWHRHKGCANATTPKTNIDFWTAKFRQNVNRDRIVSTKLKELGWRVTVVWECEITDRNSLERRLNRELSGACQRKAGNSRI